jgi:hypothetical protein
MRQFKRGGTKEGEHCGAGPPFKVQHQGLSWSICACLQRRRREGVASIATLSSHLRLRYKPRISGRCRAGRSIGETEWSSPLAMFAILRRFFVELRMLPSRIIAKRRRKRRYCCASDHSEIWKSQPLSAADCLSSLCVLFNDGRARWSGIHRRRQTRKCGPLGCAMDNNCHAI